MDAKALSRPRSRAQAQAYTYSPLGRRVTSDPTWGATLAAIDKSARDDDIALRHLKAKLHVRATPKVQLTLGAVPVPLVVAVPRAESLTQPVVRTLLEVANSAFSLPRVGRSWYGGHTDTT